MSSYGRLSDAGEVARTADLRGRTVAITGTSLEGRGGLVLEDCCEALPVGPDVHAWSGLDQAVADPETANGLWDRSLLLLDELGLPLA